VLPAFTYCSYIRPDRPSTTSGNGVQLPLLTHHQWYQTAWHLAKRWPPKEGTVTNTCRKYRHQHSRPTLSWPQTWTPSYFITRNNKRHACCFRSAVVLYNDTCSTSNVKRVVQPRRYVQSFAQKTCLDWPPVHKSNIDVYPQPSKEYHVGLIFARERSLVRKGHVPLRVSNPTGTAADTYQISYNTFVSIKHKKTIHRRPCQDVHHSHARITGLGWSAESEGTHPLFKATYWSRGKTGKTCFRSFFYSTQSVTIVLEQKSSASGFRQRADS